MTFCKTFIAWSSQAWLAIDESGYVHRRGLGTKNSAKIPWWFFFLTGNIWDTLRFFVLTFTFEFLTFWQLGKLLFKLQLVCFGSYCKLSTGLTAVTNCYKLLTALTAIKKCRQLWQLLQAVASLQAFRLFHSSHIQSPALIAESCHQLSLPQQAVDSFDSL